MSRFKIDGIEFKIAEPDALLQIVRDLHHTPQDLDYGDLRNRLFKFNIYTLMDLDISEIDLNEFNIDPHLVDEYQASIASGSTPPPIIYDADQKSIIDGIHRANAAANAGLKSIKAWVGEAGNIDPCFGDDEFCD